MFASAMMSARLRKVATSDGPLCRKKSSSATLLSNKKLVVSSSESALENVVETMLTPVTFLTKKQRKYIVVTWLAVKDRVQFGLKVYAEVFRRQPQLQVWCDVGLWKPWVKESLADGPVIYWIMQQGH